MGKYSFLKKYVGNNDLKGIYFIESTAQEISDAEKEMGITFPAELKVFYQKIGHGTLSRENSEGNVILPPYAAAEFFNFFENSKLSEEDFPLSTKDEEYWMSSLGYEIIQQGDLPFFEITGSSSFMVLKPYSDNPNAVWYMGHDKIEDSFEQFIHNLYYKSPNYWEEKLG